MFQKLYLSLKPTSYTLFLFSPIWPFIVKPNQHQQLTAFEPHKRPISLTQSHFSRSILYKPSTFLSSSKSDLCSRHPIMNHVALFALLSLVTVSSAKTITLSPSCAPDCYSTIQNAFNSCSNVGDSCTILFAPGVYPTHAAPYSTLATAQNSNNLAISGAGATILLTELTAGFAFSNISGLTITGLTFEMLRMPYTFGRVVSSTSTTVTLAVNMTTYPFPAGVAWLTKVQSVLEYDVNKQRPAANGFDLYILDTPAPLTADLSTGTVTITNSEAVRQMKRGNWYILRHQVYALNTFYMHLCRSVTLDHVTIYTAAGMGLYADFTTDVLISSLQIKKRNTASGLRPMSITADALHFNACAGTIEIRNSLFEGQGDDGLNVHSKFGAIDAIPDATSLTLQPETATEHSGLLARVGDMLTFRDRNTFQQYGQARLVALDGLHARVDAVPAGVKHNDLVVSAAWIPALIAVNNTYRNNRARGQLIKTNNVYVTGSTYDGCTGPAIQVFTDGCYWFESNAVRNWSVIGNTIVDVNYAMARLPGDVYVSACTPQYPNLAVGQVHKDVTIDRNHFEQTQGLPAVSVWAADTLSISQNTIVQSGPTAATNIQTSNSVHVVTINNACSGAAGAQQCHIKTSP
eukprot:m.81528 g.81528  ORF g.81528 m.81528 type:complete len:633 (-) comp13370_c1_seq1:99-1997(-)